VTTAAAMFCEMEMRFSLELAQAEMSVHQICLPRITGASAWSPYDGLAPLAQRDRRGLIAARGALFRASVASAGTGRARYSRAVPKNRLRETLNRQEQASTSRYRWSGIEIEGFIA
jgi:hypothetical protein